MTIRRRLAYALASLSIAVGLATLAFAALCEARLLPYFHDTPRERGEWRAEVKP